MNAVSEKPSPLGVPVHSSVAGAPGVRRSPVRRLRPVILLVVVLGVVLVANWWMTEASWNVSTDNATIQGDIAVLGPRIDGDVISVDVADNQPVRAGDRLISFDPRDRQAQLDAARGTAAEASAAIGTARRQVEQQRATIAQSESSIATAQAEQTRATAEAGRSGSLVSGGWTSRQANEAAVADRRKADALVVGAVAQRETARTTLTVAEAQLAQAEARLITAQAGVRTAENNLSYTVMKAPFDGVVGNRAVRVGQHVMPGQQLIAVTPPAASLYVTANFKETQLAAMRPGQAVLLTPDIDSKAAVHGRVASLAPATGALFSLLPPENATGNFTKVVQRVPVKIAIDPADAAAAAWLRAGLSVTAEVDTRPAGQPHRGVLGAALATLGLR